MELNIFDKYKNITELKYGSNGHVYIRLDFNGMPMFKFNYNFFEFEFENEEEADKYLSENMHKIEINLYKAELYKCYEHIENQRHELYMFNKKIN